MLSEESSEGPLIILPEEAGPYLARLSIEVELVFEALKEGYLEAQQVDSYYPSTAKGFYRWAGTNASLRRKHVRSSKEWQSVDVMNRPLLKNAADGYSITAIGGNEGTGDVNAFPNVRRKRGPATRAAVAQGQIRIQIPGLNIGVASPARDDTPPVGEWFLLYRVVDGTIMAELSYPTDIDKEGLVEDWAVRVLLKNVELEGDFNVKPLPEDEEDYDVDYWIEEA